MTTEEQLIESRIQEYNSRLKHIDELIGRAAKAENQKTEHEVELSELKLEREKLAGQMGEIGRLPTVEWARAGGPMVIWDIVAERLERLVVHLE